MIKLTVIKLINLIKFTVIKLIETNNFLEYVTQGITSFDMDHSNLYSLIKGMEEKFRDIEVRRSISVELDKGRIVIEAVGNYSKKLEIKPGDIDEINSEDKQEADEL